MKETVIVLGGSKFNKGIIDKLNKQNIQSIVIDRNNEPDIIGDINIQCDILNTAKIGKEILKIDNIKIIGVYTSSDIAIKSCNVLNSFFNLKSNEDTLLDFISSKECMTSKWRENGILNRFSEIYSEKRINIICKLSKQTKLIIKPNNASSSRGLTLLPLNPSKIIIEKAIRRAKTFSIDNKVLVEEFIEGQEMTIEMLGDNWGNVAVYGISYKYHSANTYNNKVAVKLHYNPNDLEKKKFNEIAKFGILCYKSFGLKNSFGHLEIIERVDGTLSPIEINSRSAGFIASNLLDFVSGQDYFLDYIKVLKGNKIEEKVYSTDCSSMYFFYDLPSYKESKRNVNIIQYLPDGIKSIYSDRSNIVKNKVYKIIDCDNDRYGFEILYGPKNILTYANIKASEHNFLDDFFSEL
jgi:hypothetical protein